MAETSTKLTAAGAALIALIGASFGGSKFLEKHDAPTLREAYASCETGELSGIVCCEDFLNDKEKCGMIRPGYPDPLGVRTKLEADFDALVAKQKKELDK